jgi:pSer/pThr/pTyr-binding forkhead associated (FHA) protein
VTGGWAILLRVLPAIPLYLFLGVLLWLLWQRRGSTGIVEVLAPAAHLRNEEGEAVEVHTLRPINLLGRAADNTICIADKAVSAYHARLSFQDGQWWLEDLGSRNGTRVNESRVEGPLVVTFGDVIHLGGVSLVFAPGESPAP